MQSENRARALHRPVPEMIRKQQGTELPQVRITVVAGGGGGGEVPR